MTKGLVLGSRKPTHNRSVTLYDWFTSPLYEHLALRAKPMRPRAPISRSISLNREFYRDIRGAEIPCYEVRAAIINSLRGLS